MAALVLAEARSLVLWEFSLRFLCAYSPSCGNCFFLRGCARNNRLTTSVVRALLLLPARSAQIWSKSARQKCRNSATQRKKCEKRRESACVWKRFAYHFDSFFFFFFFFASVLIVRRAVSDWQVSVVRAALIITKTVTSRTHLIKISEGTGLLQQRRRNILHTAPFFLSPSQKAPTKIISGSSGWRGAARRERGAARALY